MAKPAGNRSSTSNASLHLDGHALTIRELESLWDVPLRVSIDKTVWKRIEESRAQCESIIRSGRQVYGVNTGFGHLCRTAVSADQLDALQENLILSHAVGVGDPVPDPIVRWMMLFKLQGLSYGRSGIRKETVECLRALLDADILPIIPSQGSLGASGDLAPLAHMVLPMIGRGAVRSEGQTIDVRERGVSSGIAGSGIAPIRLSAKEGLALINGTQFMSAYAAALLVRARRALKMADIVASMSLDGLRGSVRPFDARLHEIRPHAGAIETAANLRALMASSEILESHATCGKVQDPYSLRCITPVHGASRDAVRYAGGVVETEINSVTDNPIIIDAETVISGGNFHGQPIALALDFLAIALAELASISERRIDLLMRGDESLPMFLMENTGLNSGFMMLQYTAAALVSENKVLAHPASVDSIPTSLGQEDHVSMGAHAATKAWRIMDHVETVLAIEMLCAAQALDFRLPLRAGIGVRTAHETIRNLIPFATRDRSYQEDMQSALRFYRDLSVLHAVERSAGPLA